MILHIQVRFFYPEFGTIFVTDELTEDIRNEIMDIAHVFPLYSHKTQICKRMFILANKPLSER